MPSRPTAPDTPVREDLPWDEQLPWIEVGTPRRRTSPSAAPARPASGTPSASGPPSAPGTQPAPAPLPASSSSLSPAAALVPTANMAPTANPVPTADPAPTPTEPPTQEHPASLQPQAGQAAVAPGGVGRSAGSTGASPRTASPRTASAGSSRTGTSGTTPANAAPPSTDLGGRREDASGAAGQGETHPVPRRGGLAAAVDLIEPHLRTHRWSVLIAGVLLVLGIWMLAVTPLALDHALQPPTRDGALLLGGLLALYGLVAALRTALLERAGARAATDLRGRLLQHLHRHGSPEDRAEGTIPPARFTADVATLRDLVAGTGPRLATGMLTLMALLVVLVLNAPMTALLVGVTAAVYTLVVLLGRRRLAAREQRAATEERTLTDFTQELLDARGTIRAYALEDPASEDLAAAGRRAGAARASARRARALVDLAATVIAVAAAVTALLSGTDRVLALGAVTLAVVLMHRAIGHLEELPAAASAGTRLRDLLDHSSGVADPAEARELDQVRGEITLQSLTADDPLLDGLTATVPAGQHVALLDRDGRESAALLAYLMRSAAPEHGTVLLDGQDIAGAPVADVRAHLAVVEREPALLTGTVREAIRAGRPEATDDEVTRAARGARADGFIVMLADGYDTMIDLRDPVLTDGQLRRIAIARALLRDAPVVLLDRAGDDVAPAEQAEVQHALQVLMTGRTALVRSREAHCVLAADRVLWIDGGELVEDGAPQVLAEDPDSWLSAWLEHRGA